jgi:hypothetical protein
MKKRMTDLSFRKKYVKVCLWALIIIIIISVWRALTAYDGVNTSSIYLSVSLKSPQDGVAALYYDVGKGFNDKHVEAVSVKGDEQFHDYLFKMPNKTIYNLR